MNRRVVENLNNSKQPQTQIHKERERHSQRKLERREEEIIKHCLQQDGANFNSHSYQFSFWVFFAACPFFFPISFHAFGYWTLNGRRTGKTTRQSRAADRQQPTHWQTLTDRVYRVSTRTNPSRASDCVALLNTCIAWSWRNSLACINGITLYGYYLFAPKFEVRA